jgi:hypothetical protein
MNLLDNISYLKRKAKIRKLHGPLGSFDPTRSLVALSFPPTSSADFPGASDPRAPYIAATILHEKVHWLQAVGTTLGVFCGKLESIRYSTLCAIIKTGALRPPYLEHIKRNHAAIDAAVRKKWTSGPRFLDTKIQKVFTIQEAESPIGALIESVRSLDEFLRVLEGGCTKREFVEARRFSRVLDHAMLVDAQQREGTHSSFRATDWLSKLRSAEHFAPKCGLYSLFRDKKNNVLGAWQIMEAHARISEVYKFKQALRARLSDAELVKAVNEYATAYPYGIATEMFTGVTGQGMDAVGMLLFGCVCEYALNPVTQEIDGHKGMRFHPLEIFPSMRFLTVLGAVSEIFNRDGSAKLKTFGITPPTGRNGKKIAPGFDTLEQLNFTVRVLYKNIESVTGIPSPLSCAEAIVAINRGRPTPTAIQLFQNPDREYHLRAQKLRLKHPAFFALPGWVEVVDRHSYEKIWKALNPPIWSSENRIRFTGVTNFLTTIYAHRFVGRSVMEDLLISKKSKLFHRFHCPDMTEGFARSAVKDYLGADAVDAVDFVGLLTDEKR